jgi:hypothetical protein
MKFLILNKWTGFFLFFSSRETDWCVDRWHIIIKYIRTSSNSLRVLYIYHVKLTVGEMSIGQWARFPLFISQVSFSCMQMSPHLSNSFICVRRQKRFDRSIFKRFKDSMYRPSRPVLYGQWFAIFQLRNDRYISITFHCAQIKISNICTEKRNVNKLTDRAQWPPELPNWLPLPKSIKIKINTKINGKVELFIGTTTPSSMFSLWKWPISHL